MEFFEFWMVASLVEDDGKISPKGKKGLQNAYIRKNKWDEYEIVAGDKIMTSGKNLRTMEDLLEWVKKQ